MALSDLLQALYRGDDEQVEKLLADDSELDVFEAAAFGRVERLRELLDEDPSCANAFGDDGFHPLGLACFFGHVEAARLLLERCANVNALARSQHIQTAALHASAASENKDPEVRDEPCKPPPEHGAAPTPRQAGGAAATDAAPP